jgi:DNA-binding transcriptional LysR family regulator
MADARLWQFGSGRRAVAPAVRSRLTVNNGEAMRDFAIGGLGLAMLPGFLALPAIGQGRLVEVLAGWPTRAMPVAAVWPPIRPLPAKLRRFVDFVAAELAGGAPWVRAV